MHTDQIYIARDGKSGMHVLVRILAVDDIGVDYPPIDPDNFNKLMMARDVKSLVLAARDLGPMYISADILSRRTFIPSHLQQDIECGFNLIPPNLESLLSECYFDPYAIPDEIAGMGYRAISRTGKKATRELINDFDFTIAGDLSYLDSQFRAIVEPLHDWIFARNLLSIIIRIGGLYRFGADPDTILEAARFRQVNPMVLKKRFDIDTDTCYAIPIAFNPIYRMENLADKDLRFVNSFIPGLALCHANTSPVSSLPQLQTSHNVCRLNPSTLHLLLLRSLLGELDTIRREDAGRIAVPDCKPLRVRIVRNQTVLLFDLADSLLSVLPAFGRAANRAIATSYARAALASRNILLLALDRCLEDVARHKDNLVIAYIDQADRNACNAHIDTENEPARFGRKLLVRHQRRHDRLRAESEITWIAVLHHRPSLSF